MSPANRSMAAYWASLSVPPNDSCWAGARIPADVAEGLDRGHHDADDPRQESRGGPRRPFVRRSVERAHGRHLTRRTGTMTHQTAIRGPAGEGFTAWDV